MSIHLKPLSIPVIMRELRNYETRLADVRKNIQWKLSQSTDANHTQYIESELAKIDDIVSMCHEKITKIKMISSQDIRDATLIDIQFHMSDLNLKINQMENYSEDFNRYSD